MKPSSPARLMRSASAIALLAITVGCTTTDDGQSAASITSTAAANNSVDPARKARLLRFCERMRNGGDLAVAIGLCARAHELDPEDIEPLLELATTLTVMGRHFEAAEAYRRALTIDATDGRAGFGLGRTYMKLQQYEMAQLEFESILARNDRDHRIHNVLGVVKDLRGDHPAAQANYRRGLELAPGDRTLRNNLGLSLSLSGNHESAITMLGGFVNDPAAGATSRQNLALAYGLAGNKSAAENVARIDLPANAVAQNLAVYDASRARNLSKSDMGIVPPATPQPLVSSAPLPDDGSSVTDQVATEAMNSAALQIAPAAMPARPEPTGAMAFWPLDLSDSGTAAPASAEPSAAGNRAGLAASDPTVVGDADTMAIAPFDVGPPAKHVIPPPAEHTVAWDRVLPAPESMIVDADIPKKLEPPIATAESERLAAAANADDRPMFTLQLGSYLDGERSRQAWHEIVAVAPDLFGDLNPVIQPAVIGTENGGFYWLQTTPIAGRNEAEQICAALQQQAIYCVIAQAAPDPGKLASATARTAPQSEPALVNESLTLSARSHTAPAADSGIVAKVKVVPGIAVSLVEPAAEKPDAPAAKAAESVESSPAAASLPNHGDRTDVGTSLRARGSEWGLTGRGGPSSAAATPNDTYHYRVQLGAFRQMDHANFVWRQLESKAPELLTDIGYSVERADLGAEKGVYYRLRTGSLADRSTAKALCSELQGREIDCLVVRGSVDQPTSSPKPDTDASTSPRASGRPGDDVKTSALDLDPAAERYSVQFGVYRNAEELRQNWRQFKESAPNLLTGIDPVVQRVATKTAGSPVFQLRTEQLASRDQAESLCAALRQREVDCIVVGLTTPDRTPAPRATIN